MPPQLVVCGERDFHRITQRSLEAFEIAEKLPPPQIRGSRVARQTQELAIAEPSNLVSLAKKSMLVVAAAGVYQLGEKQAVHYAPIPARAPFVVLPEPRRPGAFRVHSGGDAKLAVYAPDGLPRGAAGAASALAKLTAREEPLPDFDARLFTVLADGTPLYSTPKGLVRHGDPSPANPFPRLSAPATVLFADVSPRRYWAADASGGLGLWEPKEGASAIFTSRVPGVVIDTAGEGERVAVLSMDLVGDDYRPTVTIFSSGKQQAQLNLGPSLASQGQPKLDLCLIAGRPWVVVGGMQWLQLLDWDSRRLLSEW